jgi:hypothetical protein
MNTREQQDLCYPAAARCNEKGCLLVWGCSYNLVCKVQESKALGNNLAAWLARKKRRSQLSPCFLCDIPSLFLTLLCVLQAVPNSTSLYSNII